MENQEAEITLKSPRKPFPGWLYGILFVVFDAIGVGVLEWGVTATSRVKLSSPTIGWGFVTKMWTDLNFVAVLNLLICGARAIYAVLKLLPAQRKVVLITREPRQITVDFALLKDALRRKHPDHRVVVIKHKKLSPAYIPKAFREMYHLATCSGCLVDGYIIPVSILTHRKDLRIGQIWHALGALKKFGHLASGTREGPNPRVAATMHRTCN